MKRKLLPGEVTVRRRGSVQQGQALETLGHAVEYLVDSRLFALGEAAEQEARNSQDAVQILMRASRGVFLECPEVVPLRRRIGRWMAGRAGEGLKRAA